MNILESIRMRKSTRTFDGNPLSDSDISEINRMLENTASPFGGKVFTHIYNVRAGEDVKVPSTYGVIKGARTFMLLGVDESLEKQSLISLGYIGEAAVLKATSMGIGSCWLGGTFSRKDFSMAAAMPAGYRTVAVIPVGYPADKDRFLVRLMRKMAGSDSRKPFSELFFEAQWGKPLPEDCTVGVGLEAVRLAPSSTNSQPWRVIVAGDKIHFYYKPGQYALIDMGIALYHFIESIGMHSAVSYEDAPASADPFVYFCTVTIQKT